jgi:hypothetical protein
MKTVQAIIDLFGGLEHLRSNPIKVTNKGYMDLHVEVCGIGPRGGVVVSVAQYFTQAGDLMRDPDVEFELHPAGAWWPVRFRSDAMAVEYVCVERRGDALVTHGNLLADVEEFCKSWDQDMRYQGYLAAAREQAGK